jgi:hypothetical protein
MAIDGLRRAWFYEPDYYWYISYYEWDINTALIAFALAGAFLLSCISILILRKFLWVIPVPLVLGL